METSSSPAVSPVSPPAEAAGTEEVRISETSQWQHLGKLLTKQARKFQTLLPRVLAAHDADAVHDLRVCTRRLQQLLLMLEERADRQQVRAFRRELRRVRHALGGWRNCDVLLERVTRRERALRSEHRRAAWTLLRAAVAKARRSEIRRAQRKLFKPEYLNLRERAADLLAGIAPLDGAQATVADSLRGMVARGFEQWCEALHAAAGTPNQQAIHSLRIQMKRLRYRIELAGEFGAGEAEARLSWLRSLQDRLGRWHDRFELSLMIARTLCRRELLLAQPAAAVDLMREVERINRLDATEVPSILRELSESAGRAQMDAFIAAYTAPPPGAARVQNEPPKPSASGRPEP